jgi:hypothetical protein
MPIPLFASALVAILLGSAPASTTGLEQTLREVEALNEAINLGEPVREQLFDALARFRHHAPALAADSRARAVRARAQLNLARTYLSEGASASAAGIMDEILRSTTGEELPVEEFGPSIVALHAERRAALERAGTASIDVECQIPCRAYVNEREVAGRVDGLYLGIYRIWIEAGGESQIEWVQLSAANQIYTVRHLSPTPVESTPPLPRDRLMPLAVEIALLAVGGGLATAGTLLIGFNRAGPREQTIVGASLTGLGGAAMLVGGIGFALDHPSAGGPRGRQALLVWRMKF